MIGILDYDAGNLKSLSNALAKNNIKHKLVKKPENINNFSHYILPGVGSYPKAMKNLSERKLDLFIKDISKKNIPLLGICLGMQVLSNYGTENDKTEGLSLIEGCVESINSLKPIKNVHVGWNNIFKKKDSKLFENINLNCEFYFVHSYHFVCKHNEDILCKTNYQNEFTSGIINNNIVGLQFHPEKSHNQGLLVLKNFYQFFNA